MKIVSLLFIVLLATGLSFSQNLSIVSKDTIIMGVDSGLAGPANAVIKNISSAQLTLKCKQEAILWFQVILIISVGLVVIRLQ